jgi:hypothetical protein
MTISSTQSAVVYTKVEAASDAGKSLGEQVLRALDGESPDALILFVAPRYNAPELLRAVNESCRPKLLVGCSSAGEFTNETVGEGQACAIALRSSEVRFAAGIGRDLSRDRAAAAKDITDAFRGVAAASQGYSAALVLTDALAGHADELIEQLTLQTGGNHQFFGGGAGDDANFKRTQVFLGLEVASDAAVALEILSPKPIGIGVRHGWQPAGKPMRVTEADGMRLVSLNAAPAVEAFQAHAEATGQQFDHDAPIPFFLHNILGIDTGDGFKLRVPLALHADGSLSCAAEIPAGSSVCIMSTNPVSACDAAAGATRDALSQLNGHEPRVALFFDCVATRLRMGREFAGEVSALKDVLGSTPFAGCNTYGQVARTEGQFNGFHNCTAVVCVLPA